MIETFFQKVNNLINQKKISIKDGDNVIIPPDELTTYLNNGKEFLEIIKKEFNSAQKGYPTMKKFVKVIIETEPEKSKKDLYMFHITFRRELDAAFRVKQNYDFVKFSGFKESHIYDSEDKIIFKENDILLFELKDTTFSNSVATFINKNYYVLNSHIELLKELDNFKNCRFFYIGVQEQNNQNVSNNNNINNDKNEVYEKIREKQEKSSLKVKLFEFINDTIFHVDLKLVDPEKLKYLYVLKDEFDEIRSNKIKLLKIENDVRELKNVIYIMLAVIICLVSLLIMINFKKL